MVLALVAAFCGQTLLVYGDATGRELPPLSAAALRGRALWHSHGCQACHQLHGFGGFLGPDLTNLATRAGEGLSARLAGVLDQGRGAMPAFHLSRRAQEDLAQFLVAMNATGVGQVRLGGGAGPRDVLAQALKGVPPPSEDVAAGGALAESLGCIDCHSPKGPGPDLTRLSERLSTADIDARLSVGLPQRGMPAFQLDSSDRARVRAWLEWLAANGRLVRAAFARAERSHGPLLSQLPWFEY